MADMADLDPYTTPSLKAPPGHTSNLANPYSLQSYLVATSVICLTLLVFSIAARLFVKGYILKKLQLEDYVLVLAGCGFAAFDAGLIYEGRYGQGRHQWDVSIHNAQQLASSENIVEILYCPTIFLAKLFCLLQLMSIFKGNRKDSVYWAIQVLIWTNAIFYTTTFFCFIFACVPRAKIQDPTLPGTCLSTPGLILATSAINIASDFSILFLPIYAIWKLKLALKRKIGVAAIFGTGLFACIASIVRLVYTVRLNNTTDSSYVIGQVAMWAIAEFSTVILAGTFPTIPRLIQWFLGKRNQPTYTAQSFPHQSRSGHPRTNRSDLEGGGTSWRGSDTTKLTDSYIPLDDHVVPSNWKSGQGSRSSPSEGELSTLPVAFDPLERNRNEALMTVRVETRFGGVEGEHQHPNSF